MMAKIDSRGGNLEMQGLCMAKCIYDWIVQASRTKEEAASWPIMTPNLPAVFLSLSQTNSNHLKRFSISPNQLSIAKQKLDCGKEVISV